MWLSTVILPGGWAGARAVSHYCRDAHKKVLFYIHSVSHDPHGIYSRQSRYDQTNWLHFHKSAYSECPTSLGLLKPTTEKVTLKLSSLTTWRLGFKIIYCIWFLFQTMKLHWYSLNNLDTFIWCNSYCGQIRVTESAKILDKQVCNTGLWHAKSLVCRSLACMQWVWSVGVWHAMSLVCRYLACNEFGLWEFGMQWVWSVEGWHAMSLVCGSLACNEFGLWEFGMQGVWSVGGGFIKFESGRCWLGGRRCKSIACAVHACHAGSPGQNPIVGETCGDLFRERQIDK